MKSFNEWLQIRDGHNRGDSLYAEDTSEFHSLSWANVSWKLTDPIKKIDSMIRALREGQNIDNRDIASWLDNINDKLKDQEAMLRGLHRRGQPPAAPEF